ncbi:helix-turn-helix transcriptional regulator [Streptosporangium sp. NPDC049248]|uniref:helix-turn-helix domain-containing protein n=1 Tax=Streptosporangium sp. NPDC049248 TaxID=3155651 RepID=UPI003416357C
MSGGPEQEANTDEFPTRKLVGARLRQLREAVDGTRITARAAGRHIGASDSKMSRLENGFLPFRRDDLTALLTLYGVTDPYQQEALISVAMGERQPSWWDDQQVPLEATALWGLEQTASYIRTYQPIFVPPLLQTEEYAAEFYRITQHQPPASVIETSVKRLARRQRILTEHDSRFWAIIEEPVLWRPIANLKTHIEQLDVLIRACQDPRITIQVNRMTSGFVPECGPFSVFRFDDKPQMIAFHRQGKDVIIPRRSDEQHVVTFDRVAVAAARAHETPKILTEIRARIPTVVDF